MNKIFRKITLQVRSFHRAGVYCGDVCNTVQIDPYNVKVCFPFLPAKDHRFREGVRCDTLHFRYLVTVDMRDLNADAILAFDFRLFILDERIKKAYKKFCHLKGSRC